MEGRSCVVGHLGRGIRKVLSESPHRIIAAFDLLLVYQRLDVV